MMQQQKSRNFFKKSLEKCVIQLAPLEFSVGGGGRANVKKGQFESNVDIHLDRTPRRRTRVHGGVHKNGGVLARARIKRGKEEERRKQIISPKLSSSSIYALKQN
jgi:hypothetical protein